MMEAQSHHNKSRSFNELLVVCDDQTWVWNFVNATLDALKCEHVRMASKITIRQCWDRFKESPRVIIYWENTQRSGGAVIEEILSISPHFDVADRIIVLTSDPTHEDVVYFSELGIAKVVRLKNRPRDLEAAATELKNGLEQNSGKNPGERAWQKFYRALAFLSSPPEAEQIKRLADNMQQLREQVEKKDSARFWDARASLLALQGKKDDARQAWEKAIELNPSFFRAYNNLVDFLMSEGKQEEALSIMKRMQTLNKANISRLVKMGEAHVGMGDDVKAEHYFRSALERDATCSSALNGMAEIRFRQNELEESRSLLAQSSHAYKIAALLNKQGINLVRTGRYEDALAHYTKAQYVLPHQDKGPMLFYNIGLCYARWSKPHMAEEFLKLALIKDPKYEKAQRLLEQVLSQIGQVA